MTDTATATAAPCGCQDAEGPYGPGFLEWLTSPATSADDLLRHLVATQAILHEEQRQLSVKVDGIAEAAAQLAQLGQQLGPALNGGVSGLMGLLRRQPAGG